jgi:predicted permease
MEALLQDMRAALRAARANRGFSALAIGMLAIGIAANSAIFSIVNGVLLKPLPYAEPDRLFSVYTRFLASTGYEFPFFALSGPEYQDYVAHTQALDGIVAYTFEGYNLAGEDERADRVTALSATANMFDVLRVTPVIGRGFLPGDDDVGAPCVTVLAHAFWTERFAADAGIVGRDIRLDSAPCRVIGVMPSGFFFPVDQVRLWVPLALDPASPQWGRQNHGLAALARLAPGATEAQAIEETQTLRQQWSEEFPDHYAAGHFAVLLSLTDDILGNTRGALLLLLAAVGLVLLIVCANIAGLLLARGASRHREMAVRAALGARRARLVRQLLAENLLLAIAGGIAGAVLAEWMLQAMLSLYPSDLPRVSEVAIDRWVLLFTAFVSLGVGLLVGIVPALQTSGIDLRHSLTAESRTSTTGRAGIRLRRTIVVAEVALGLILVLGATLLIRSYNRLRTVDVGFDPADVIEFGIVLPELAYPELDRVQRFHIDLRERLLAIPGVQSAAAMSSLPLVDPGPPDDFAIENKTPPPGQAGWAARYLMVTPGLIETLRIPLLRGRSINNEDIAGRPLVAVISQAAAQRYWPNEDPIGQRIRYFSDPDRPLTVVGIVGDVRSIDITSPPEPAVYVSHAQAPRVFYPGRSMTVVVRASAQSLNLPAAARSAVASIDASLPLVALAPLPDIVSRSLGQPRFTMLVMIFFAAMALLLGASGIYGVIAQTVHQRTQEIGIRMALGAGTRDVLHLVLAQGLGLILLGIATGLAVAFAARRAIAGLLFDIAPHDPATLTAATLLLLAAGLMACWLPARTATRVDPARAMRSN